MKTIRSFGSAFIVLLFLTLGVHACPPDDPHQPNGGEGSAKPSVPTQTPAPKK